MQEPIKVIVTGSTGMVGKGVMLECIDDPRLEQVLVVNRNTVGITHPKLKEVLHPILPEQNYCQQTNYFKPGFHMMVIPMLLPNH